LVTVVLQLAPRLQEFVSVLRPQCQNQVLRYNAVKAAEDLVIYTKQSRKSLNNLSDNVENLQQKNSDLEKKNEELKKRNEELAKEEERLCVFVNALAQTVVPVPPPPAPVLPSDEEMAARVADIILDADVMTPVVPPPAIVQFVKDNKPKAAPRKSKKKTEDPPTPPPPPPPQPQPPISPTLLNMVAQIVSLSLQGGGDGKCKGVGVLSHLSSITSPLFLP
jgi:FtsZ-binding cell division protein ZapB